MNSVYAVGIDLGTTNSAMAYVTPAGRTAMIPNELEEYFTPSCVYFDDHEVVVGRPARKARFFDPVRVAWEPKRRLGFPADGEQPQGEFPPEVVQACLFRHLKTILDQRLGPACEIVITVPAFFDETRRQSVIDSARLAGLSVLEVINEPTAAAIAYAECHGYLDRDTHANSSPLQLLVYDLGGGTFDVSLVRLAAGETRMLATDGDVRLGGSDWDQRLADYIAQKFEGQYRIDPRDDPLANARLVQLAEDAKQSLSTRMQTVIEFEFRNSRLPLTITREQFEILTADLLERTAHTTREVLAASGLASDAVDKVVLSGGATRMPMVRRMLEDVTGRVPDSSINPDEAVARGAAIYAAHLLQLRGVDCHLPSWRFVNVNAHSLGIEGVDPITSRRINTILIPRNSPLPCQALYKFVTKKANQDSISIKILEGESTDPEQCILIGKAMMRNLPQHLPRGTHIEVIYEYQSNGRLRVSVGIRDTDHEMSVELQRAGSMSDDRLRAWSGVVATGGGYQDFAKVLEEVLGVRAD